MQVRKIWVVVHPHFFVSPSQSFFDRQMNRGGCVSRYMFEDFHASISNILKKKKFVDSYYRSIIEVAIKHADQLVVIISGCTEIGTTELELSESADRLFSPMITRNNRLRLAAVCSRYQARLVTWSSKFQNVIVVNDDIESDPDTIGTRIVKNKEIRFNRALDEVYVEVLGETYRACVDDALRSMQSVGFTNSFALQDRCPA